MINFINKHIIDLYSVCWKGCAIVKRKVCVIFGVYFYITLHKKKCNRIMIKTWFDGSCFKLNRVIFEVFIFCCLNICSIPYFCSKFGLCIAWIIFESPFYIILYNTHSILWKIICFFCFLDGEKHCCSFISIKPANKINSVCNALKNIHNRINYLLCNHCIFLYQ